MRAGAKGAFLAGASAGEGNVYKPVHSPGPPWLGIVFTLTVIANFVAIAAVGEPPAWITYSPLFPLFLMLASGLYLFVLPYRRKAGR